MKTMAELQAIRDKMKNEMGRSGDANQVARVVVGMATCGIAAGARPVLTALMDEVSKRKLSGVTITQTGCVGLCQYEPIVEVYMPGQEKVTYINMTPEKALTVINEHVVNKNVVTRYTVGGAN